MILFIIAIAIIMCIVILCVIILGILALGVIGFIMLGVVKFIIGLVIFLIAGWNQTYTEQDFADSRWEDSAGTVIELYSDGTCSVQDLKWELIGWQGEHPSSFDGSWTIKSNEYDEQEIAIKREIDERWWYEIEFTIEDINVIKRFIGDPDNWEFYELTRKQ